MTKVFFSNYHISVNKPLVQDLLACGLEVVVPSHAMHQNRISFFAPNDEHVRYAGVQMVDWNQYLEMDPMLMIIPCTQMVDDFLKIHEQRKAAGKEDVIVLLTANSDHQPAWRKVPTDFVMSHDLTYHREFDGWKMLYFSRPTILRRKKTADELARSFDEQKVKCYINNLEHDPGLKPELKAAREMQRKWKIRSDTKWKMPMYGYGNKDGWPQMPETQDHIVDSMFTFVSKRRETWGQLINESMQLGTPCMFLRPLLNSTFTEYLINDDTAIVGDTVDELIEKALALDFKGYQTLVNEAYSQSQMFCNEDIRREKLRWLLDKAAAQLPEIETGAEDPQ